MSSRDVILGRVRQALRDVSDAAPAADVPVDWSFGRPVRLDGDVLDVFVERVVDYRAVVVRCGADEVGVRIVEALADAGSAVLPAGLPAAWVDAVAASGVAVRRDEPQLTHRELDATDAVVTASAVGIAETGTIVLDHAPDQGRRALTLVPDLHVCVIRADQVVSGVPEAVARLGAALASGAPLTWISGPSATSDIELERVEGVHGPRTLHVILVDG